MFRNPLIEYDNVCAGAESEDSSRYSQARSASSSVASLRSMTSRISEQEDRSPRASDLFVPPFQSRKNSLKSNLSRSRRDDSTRKSCSFR